jgi:putative transposase
VDFENNKVKLPKIGWVKTKLHRKYCGDGKTATISRTSTGKYYISILVDDGLETPSAFLFDEKTTVGVDVGIKDFAILSNGERIENPKYLKTSIPRLVVLQKRLSRKQKGSKNRAKARFAVSKAHERIRNQRNDFQHKLSSKLISENQAVALETLNVSGMLKNHCLAQSIADTSWSSFVTMLDIRQNGLEKQYFA